MPILNNTPIEFHEHCWVKQEGETAPAGWPKFSKIRGVVAHIAARSESVIGALDTVHSKAGWAVAAACAELGKQCVAFYPVRKAEALDPEDIALGPQVLKPQQRAVETFGGVLRPLRAGRSAVLYHAAKKRLREEYPDSYMMPNALKLPESITETAEEVVRSAPFIEAQEIENVVISISSGTIAAGVIAGLDTIGYRGRVFLHLGYARPRQAVRDYIIRASGVRGDWILIDEGYQYADAVNIDCPFPCNAYYDLKAWRWILTHGEIQGLNPQTTLFWNIGE